MTAFLTTTATRSQLLQVPGGREWPASFTFGQSPGSLWLKNGRPKWLALGNGTKDSPAVRFDPYPPGLANSLAKPSPQTQTWLHGALDRPGHGIAHNARLTSPAPSQQMSI